MSTKRINEPGIYTIPAEVYHADPCETPSASSSLLKLMMSETPAHAWTAHPRLNPDFESSDGEERFDRGHACHILMLNDEEKFCIIEADNYKTNAAKAARAQAYLDGLVPIIAGKWPEVVAMCAAGKKQLADHADASDVFEGILPEQTLVWCEEYRGIKIWCRARLDGMHVKPDGTPQHGKIYGDYKSLAASINPNNLHRYAETADWAFQQAFYCRGIRKLIGEDYPDFRFVVQEASAPFRLIVAQLAPMAVQIADRKVEYALDLWAWCMKNNLWPGFPNQTVTLGMSPWANEAFTGREIMEEDDRKAGKDVFEKMRAWQAPL